MATTDNQRHLSDTAVLLPFGIPEPWPTCGSRVGEKDESATSFSIPIYFALPLGWLRFWPSLIAFALALIGAGTKKIRPDCVLEFRQDRNSWTPPDGFTQLGDANHVPTAAARDSLRLPARLDRKSVM